MILFVKERFDAMPIANFKVSLADETQTELLTNLYQLYMHDMSDWFEIETGPDGRFDNEMETFWTENKSILIAWSGSQPVGFAVVQSAERFTGDPNGFDMKEFFVLRSYRRSGAGTQFIRHIWKSRPGGWIIRVVANNRPAVPFWRSVVAAYTENDFHEEKTLRDGNEWIYLTFDSEA